MTTRYEVYLAIDSERDYQDSGLGNAKTSRPDKALGEWILCMQHLIDEARRVWYSTPIEDQGSANQVLDFVRKATAVGVICMEQHGAPLRK